MRSGRPYCVAFFLGALALPAAAQAPRLGTISFPTSGPPTARESFVRGVLYLHSFEYDAAAEAFRAAQQAAPEFAMAYWGEAMTYNHPLWGAWDDAAARAALARLAATPGDRRARAATERERMYLEAVEALWAEGPKPRRDTAYSRAMERLVGAYPDDDEARTFYALSILGLSGTTRVFESYMRAAALAGDVFRRHPDHPGAAHYLIHSFDDPIHAPLGLPAARAYSGIAPDAAHAQHMTTHIFLALGMWDDVVSQNTLAANQTWWGPGHYTYWLTYALAQQGKFAEAERRIAEARDRMADRARPGTRGYFARMWAQHLINAERWDHPMFGWDLDLGDVSPAARAAVAFTRGFAALRRGDPATARDALARVEAARGGDARAPDVLALELRALLTLEAGDPGAALALLDSAAAIEDALPMEFGPPDIVKPSHELRGEVLLALGRRAEARRAFEAALRLAPGRALALRGLEQASR